jgi:adenylylsulfate reductase subunit B
MALLIDLEGCVSCGLCADVCPGDIIYMDGDFPTVPYVDECWYCGICRDSCPVDVISFELPPAYVGKVVERGYSAATAAVIRSMRPSERAST